MRLELSVTFHATISQKNKGLGAVTWFRIVVIREQRNVLLLITFQEQGLLLWPAVVRLKYCYIGISDYFTLRWFCKRPTECELEGEKSIDNILFCWQCANDRLVLSVMVAFGDLQCHMLGENPPCLIMPCLRYLRIPMGGQWRRTIAVGEHWVTIKEIRHAGGSPGAGVRWLM